MPFAVAVFAANAMIPAAAEQPVRGIGLAILAVAAPLIFAPFYYFQKYGNVPAGKAYFETTQVVARGPFRLVRHPQYLGYALLMVGFAVISLHPLVVAPAGVAGFFFYLQIRAEDEQCMLQFGQAYRDYASRVPRINLLLGLLRMLRNKP